MLGLLQLTVLARFLPPEEFGLAAVVVAAATYVCLAGEPPIVGYERLGAQDRTSDLTTDAARLAAQSVLAVTAGAVLIVSLGWGIAVRDVAFALAIAIWAISLIQLRWSVVQFLNWGQRSAFAVVTLLNSTVRVVFCAGIAWYSRDGSIALMAGGIGSIVITALISPTYMSWRWNKKDIKRILRIGVPAAVPAVAYTSMTVWPTFAASMALDAEQFPKFAAQFSLASAIAAATLSFLLMFGFPVVKRLWDSGEMMTAIRHVGFYSWLVVAASLSLALFAAVVGRWFTALLLSPGYSGAAVLSVGLLAWGVLLLCRPASWIMRLQYRQNLLGILVASAALLQIPAVWVGTAVAGVPGLLLAMTAVSFLQTSVVLAVGMGRRAVPLQITATILTVAGILASLFLVPLETGI